MLRRFFSLPFDLRIYWLLLPFVAFYLFSGSPNTPEFAWPIFIAFVASGIPLHFSKYRWTSFVSIFVLAHVIQYPLAALLVLSLSHPSLSIEAIYWATTPASMWAMALGILGLACGVAIANLTQKKGNPPEESNLSRSDWLTPLHVNMVLISLVFVAVTIYLLTGIYYHSNVAEYNVAASQAFGFVGYLVYLGNAGVLLQLRRYLITKTKKDLIYLILGALFAFVLFLPSGSRRWSFFTLFTCGIAFFQWGENKRLKIFFFASLIIFSAVLLPVLEAYRSAGVAGVTTLSGRIGVLKDYLFQLKSEESGAGEEVITATLAHRLADYVSVGHIIDVVPNVYPYWGFDDVGQWFLYLLPTLIRPETELSFAYDAEIMEKYGFRTNIGGSSPTMILGDMYNRAGWSGIFVCMVIIGYILWRLDLWVMRGTFQSVLVWTLLLDSMINLHAYTLLKLFTALTRQFAIFFLIALFLEKIIFRNRSSIVTAHG